MTIIAYTPHPEDVSSALWDVAYEIEQLVGNFVLLDRLMQGETVTADPLEEIIHPNVYLEGFLLHLRVLVDFFERQNRTRRKNVELDDVLSSDYGFQASRVDLDAESRDRINQEVTHLSYSRVHRRDTRDWYPAPLARPVLDRCDQFLDHVLRSDAVAKPKHVEERLSRVSSIVKAVVHGGGGLTSG